MGVFGHRIWRSKLIHAISANVVIQFSQIAVQIALVPIFISHLGLADYGFWLMLFTIPSYLAMADLGLASAAANDMTASVARGERQAAVATFQAVRLVVLIAGGVVVAIAALLLFVLAPHLLDQAEAATGGHARLAMMALVVFGAFTLQNSVISAGFRCTGGYAVSGYLWAAMNVAEAGAGVAAVVSGGGILGAALAYMAMRIVSSLLLGLLLTHRAPWLMTLRWQSSGGVLRRLLRPALAVMVVPLAQAASLQGTVLVIGIAAGSAAVPAFTALRTLSRVALQAILIVNHAVMPSFTVASAQEDQRRVGRLTLLSFATSLVLVVPAALALLFAGRWIVQLWTHGAVSPSFALIAVIAAMMLFNSLWQPAANLILSINRHESFSWFYLAVSLIMVALCYPLARASGATGAALSVLAVDILMLVRVFGLSRRMGLTDLGEVRAFLHRAPWRRPRRGVAERNLDLT